MISYTEKGIGLHDRVLAAGHQLHCVNGVWESDNDVDVQAIIDGYTLDHAKSAKCIEVSAVAKTLRDKAISTISAGEMASWSIKLSEAAKFSASGDVAQCPMLSAEALSRGITVAALAAKVGGNATMFSALEAQIGGNDGRHRDAIKLLTTFDDIARYDFSSGWPAV